MDAELQTELAQIKGTLATLLRLFAAKRPDMTITQFAQEAKRSRTWVHDRINQGAITIRRGRIPASELSKFTS